MNYERNAELKIRKYIGHIIITITTTKLQYKFQKVTPQDERKIHFRCSISIDFFFNSGRNQFGIGRKIVSSPSLYPDDICIRFMTQL